MTNRSFRRSLSALSGVSLIALAAAMPHTAYAQSTDVGAPGQALTAGTVSSATGTVTDGGDTFGVQVASGDDDIVGVDNAAIDASGGGNGLSITNFSAAPGVLDLNFTGANTISGTGAAVYVATGAENLMLDATGGGSTFTGVSGFQVSSSSGSITVLNGANTFNTSLTGISASVGGTGSVTVASEGGSITGGHYGIAVGSQGGAVAVGQGGGVTTAISGVADAGITASTNGAGTIDITTGAGGTIDGGAYGVMASTNGSGAINVSIGDQVGGASAPTATAVFASSNGGAVSVTSTAQITGGTGGVLAQTTGGTGSVTVETVGVSSTGGTAVQAGVFGNGSGNVSVTLDGANTITGPYGVTATTNGAGNVSVTAADAGSSINGSFNRGVDAEAAGGSVTVTTGGTIHGGIDGVYTRNSGAGTTTISATGPVSGMRGVNAQSSGTGAITIGNSGSRLGAVTATNGDGVYAKGGGAVSVYTNAVTTAGGGGVGTNAQGIAQNSFYGSGLGIDAVSTGGSVVVNAGGAVTGGQGGGILAQGAGAGNTVTVTTGAVTTTGGRGVEADGAGGLVTVNAGGLIHGAGDGIYATNTGTGGVTVSAASGATSTTGSAIRVRDYGGGALNVGSALDRVGALSGGDAGLRVVGNGSLSVYATSVSGVTNGILTSGGQANAINAQVLVDATGPVTSVNFGRTGVQAYNFGQIGNSAATVNLTGAVTANGLGVDAETMNGDVTVVTAAVTAANHGDSWSTGVLVDGGGDSQVSVTTNGAVIGGAGLNVIGEGTLARDTITVVANGAVTGQNGAAVRVTGRNALVSTTTVGQVSATGGAGVFSSGDGAVTVVTNGVAATGGTAPAQNGVGGVTGLTAANGYGVAAVSTSGPVSVTANGAVSGGAAGGIAALSTGAGSVTVTAGAVSTTGGRGIEADSAGGLVTVNSGGVVTGATGGIYANNTGPGGININTAAAVTGLTSTGVRANTTGSGTVNLGTSGQRLATVTGGASGVVGTGGGDVNVYATTVTGATNAIVAQSVQPGANGAVTVDASGTLTGNSGYGVLALNTGLLAADTTTVTTTGAINSAGGAGIDAESTGGDVTVTASGVITAIGGNGTFWDGVYARGAGDSAVSVTTNAAVNGSYQGIDVATAGTLARDTVTVVAADSVTSQHGAGISAAGRNGLISINAIGAVTAAGGDGVFAKGDGAVSVTTNQVTVTGGSLPAQSATGQVTGVTAFNGYAIAALSTAGPVDVNSNATVSGGAGGGIVAQTGGTGAITINSAAVSAVGGRGIEADGAGGLVTINAGGPVSSVGDAIYATNTGGDIDISAASGATSTAGSGIRGRVYTSGVLNVGSALDRVGAVSGGDAGIRAVSDGSLNVYATSVSGVTNGILTSGGQAGAINAQVLVDATGPVTSVNAGRTGVQAYNFGQTGNSGVTVNLGGDVTANGVGVDAETVNGDITVATAAVAGGNNGDAYSTGVLVDGGGDSRISVTTNGAVSGGAGVNIIGEGTLARDTVSVTTNGSVTGLAGAGISAKGHSALVSVDAESTVASTGGAGVFASGNGAVNVVTHGVTTAGGSAATAVGANPATGVNAANGFGIAVVSTGGNVMVASNGTTSGGLGGGIIAQSAGIGTVTVNAGAVGTSGGKAIEADAQGGLITINTTGLVNSAAGGIYATNTGVGGININTAAAVSGGAFNGIRATANGGGAINLGSAGQSLADVTSTGITAITATGRGDVNVFATNVSGGTHAIAAQSINAGANGVVNVNATGVITGAHGFGVIAHNGGTLAANTVSVTTGGAVTSTGGTAVDAEADGGDVTVHTSGVLTANAGNGQYWDAIFAHGAGDSAVTVTTDADVNGSYMGIDAASAGTTTRSTVTVNANAAVSAGYPGVSAIQAISSGQGSVVVNKAANGALSAAGGYGITASATASTGTANVSVTNAAQIGSAGAGQTLTGINAAVAAGNAGSITVASNTGAIYASGTGISAVNAGSGSVDIGATSGGISSAINTAGVGIFGSTVSGAVNITTAAGGTISPGAAIGIEAHSVSGAVTINQAGDIGAAGAGNTVGEGIHAVIDGGAGALTIHSTGRIYVAAGIGPTSAGIYAVNGGTGAVVVTSTGLIDPGAYGAYIQGAGPVSYTASGGAVEGDTGVFIQSTGGGAVNLTSTGGTPITGLNGAGVVADSGAGDTTIVTNGAVSGTTTGISATSTGAGSTSLTTHGAVSGGTGAGIVLNSGTGGLALNVNGDVTSTGAVAIDATSAAGGVININSGSHITGLVSTANTGVINLNTASGSSTTVNVSSGATVSAAAGSAFNIAVEAHGGSVTVNNSGVITGQVDFSHLTGANTGALVNAPGTVFQTGGTSLFNVGDDNFANSGQIDTVGALTTFDFLGGVNHVNNAGTIRVGFNPVAASSFRLIGVSQFANSGTLQMQNGVVGDSIVANGAAFTGAGASKLSVDANLGGPGSLSDTLTVASTGGVTKLYVHDTGATFGAYNPAGIVVVNGTTHAGDFAFDPTSSYYNGALFGGVLDKPGMFFYDLAVNNAGAAVLISAPKREAEQLTNLGAQAQTLWYSAAPGSESFAQRRETFFGGAPQADQPVVWVNLTGAYAQRDHTQHYADFNKDYAYDTSYRQDIGGVTFGADSAWRGDQAGSGSWQFGLTAAYVTSDASFDNSSTRAKMEGAAVSAHASFLKGDVFADLAYSGDILKGKVSAPALAGLTGKPDITSNGGFAQVGLRKPFVGGSVIEPTISVSYVRSNIGDLAAGGETLHFEDAESLRVGMGVRVSGQLSDGETWRVGYSLSARAVDELKGANAVGFTGMGAPLVLTDHFDRGFGEVGGGLNFEGKGGWSGFANASWMFNSEYSSPSISLGGRYRF